MVDVETARDRALIRIGGALAFALALLPFLFVKIPPLSDAPGHLAQMAIASAAPDSPLRRYFDFAWGLRLNLGTDLLVVALAPIIGLERAFWLVCATIPMLVVAAILALAGRAKAPAAAGFALPFAYAYPFSFGFLNFMLGMALALLGFAGWRRLADRPRLREPVFWVILPTLMIVHAIGGGLLPLLITAEAISQRLRPYRGAASILALLRDLRPLIGVVAIVWLAHPAAGRTVLMWTLDGKANALVQALRDQNRLFDIASMVLTIVVPLLGWRLGARYDRGAKAAMGALALLFVVIPTEISGSAYNDLRLVPPFMIIALALQDWSRVDRRWVRAVAVAGIALFGVRMAVTTQAFAGYARAFDREMRALAAIPPGARVIGLVTRRCKASVAWRSNRLEHLPAMTIVQRDAWTNAMWDVASIHLLDIRYRPSPDFYHDPSHYVWPTACVDAGNAAERRTIAQAAPRLPLDRIDYLWLIQASLPAGPWMARLVPLWSQDGSTLYRVSRPAAPAPH